MDGDTRETIRAVALELFSTKGFEQTSLREIAERVGLTKASLYYHYPSKQALLLAVVEPVLTGWHAIADDTASLDHTPAHVRQIMARCLDVLAAQPGDRRGLPAGPGRRCRGRQSRCGRTRSTSDDGWSPGSRGRRRPAVDRIRAAAAMEVLGAALASATYGLGEVSDAELRDVLLTAALDVLRLPAEPVGSEMRNVG